MRALFKRLDKVGAASSVLDLIKSVHNKIKTGAYERSIASARRVTPTSPGSNITRTLTVSYSLEKWLIN